MTTKTKTVTISPAPKTMSRGSMLELLFTEPGTLIRLEAGESEGWFRREQGVWRYPGSPTQTLAAFITANSNTDIRFSPLGFASLSSGGPVAPVRTLWCSIPILTLPQGKHMPRPPIDPADRIEALRRISGFKPEPCLWIDEGDRLSLFWRLADGLRVDDIRLVQARWRLASLLEGDLAVAASDGRTTPSFAIPETRVTSVMPVADVTAFPWAFEQTHPIDRFLELKNGGRR